jgi:hypothetical protein
MYFDIRRRNKGYGKAQIVESGFATREEAKPRRDELNRSFYKDQPVPEHNRERSHNHRHGPSK